MSQQLIDLDVSGGSGVSMDDVMNIVVSKAELQYKQKCDDWRKVAFSLDKQLCELTELLDDFTKQIADDTIGHIVDGLNSVIGKLPKDKCRGLFSSSISKIKTSGGEMTISCNVSTGCGHPVYFDEIQLSEQEKASATNIQAEIEEKTRLKKEANEKAMEYRNKLSNIPLLERQFRAKIAENRLLKSDSGREILELLSGQMEEAIENLPV